MKARSTSCGSFATSFWNASRSGKASCIGTIAGRRGAADWLIDHPVFRFPVLLALLPLQAMAWMILHPVVLGLLAVIAIGLSLAAYFGAFVRDPQKSGGRSRLSESG